MPKFRKKPVLVEAIKLGWDTWGDICILAKVSGSPGAAHGVYVAEDGYQLPANQTSDRIGLILPTPEGVMLAVQGDWIIQGVNGELYPCKPDIFEKTYEKVER